VRRLFCTNPNRASLSAELRQPGSNDANRFRSSDPPRAGKGPSFSVSAPAVKQPALHFSCNPGPIPQCRVEPALPMPIDQLVSVPVTRALFLAPWFCKSRLFPTVPRCLFGNTKKVRRNFSARLPDVALGMAQPPVWSPPACKCRLTTSLLVLPSCCDSCSPEQQGLGKEIRVLQRHGFSRPFTTRETRG
jgi:hypothetical protein